MTRRVAFLIGNQFFRPDSGLTPLRGPLNDVAAMSRLLSDADRGNFSVQVFLDKPRHEVLPEIEQALSGAKPGDLVLIYYSGHGKLDRNGRVCLATADTRENALQATSIPARHLTDLVAESDCDQVVLLLDCCYSGAVDEGLRGGISSEMQIIEDARGFFILTASTEHQAAREMKPGPDGKVMGRFTAAFVEGIETGAADADGKGYVLLSDLREHVERAVVGQTPRFFARKASGDPLISRSPAHLVRRLDADALADLRHAAADRRLAAVQYLMTLVQTGPAPAKAAARSELEQHLVRERDAHVRKRIEDGLQLPLSYRSGGKQKSSFWGSDVWRRRGIALLCGAVLLGGAANVAVVWQRPGRPPAETALPVRPAGVTPAMAMTRTSSTSPLESLREPVRQAAQCQLMLQLALSHARAASSSLEKLRAISTTSSATNQTIMTEESLYAAAMRDREDMLNKYLPKVEWLAGHDASAVDAAIELERDDAARGTMDKADAEFRSQFVAALDVLDRHVRAQRQGQLTRVAVVSDADRLNMRAVR